MRREEAAGARDRRAAAAQQDVDEVEESDANATEDEATGGRTTRVGATARWHEGCSENRRGTAKEIERGRRPRPKALRVGDG